MIKAKNLYLATDDSHIISKKIHAISDLSL